MDQYICPHCNDSIDVEEDDLGFEWAQRVLHLVEHALRWATGRSNAEFSDPDVWTYGIGSDSWEQTALNAHRLIRSSYGDLINAKVGHVLKLPLGPIIPGKKRHFLVVPPQHAMLCWIEHHYPNVNF